MLLTRLYLRNFRVYEDELELFVPPGLVGIYGPNGAGKSTLLEAILFTLWGRAKTPKEQIRSAGVGGDCVTEIEFEHEGHLYVVRRTLTGINSTIRAEAHCDGLIMSEGVRDTGRYLHSVLGMDDAAFRASVFAEQKQLAAFSSQTPAERRRLVLQLLGIIPLDGARDAARRDARSASEQHRHLREVLPDLDLVTVAAADSAARAGASAAVEAEERGAVALARRRAEQQAQLFVTADQARQEYDRLVIEGRAARAELGATDAHVTQLSAELEDLAAAGVRLHRADATSANLEADQRRVDALRRALDAFDALAAVVVPAEPDRPDEAAHAALLQMAADAREGLAAIEGGCRASSSELARAREQAERSATLSAEEDCPVCGQALGEAFVSVQAHRSIEVSSAESRLAAATAERDTAVLAAGVASADARAADEAFRAAVAARQDWAAADARHREAEMALHRVLPGALSAGQDLDLLPDADPPSEGLGPRAAALDDRHPAADRQAGGRTALIDREVLAGPLRILTARVSDAVVAAREADRLRGRLERRPAVEAASGLAVEQRDRCAGRVAALRDQVRLLEFDPEALARVRRVHDDAMERVVIAEAAVVTAAVAAAEAGALSVAAAERLAEARAQHDLLGTLETDVRHLSRVADLLSEFRNTVVASVGPRLALQAAELFGELTDHDYDELQVNAETYELQISDAGRTYGLDRFSGSEVDLANLALRVAISEHIRFQSGGSVGLLVLDEVFGPLDQDRKDRMLLALERLKGRFRQVLVVTHDPNIKEQMPAAIEVIKRPGRRATARVVT